VVSEVPQVPTPPEEPESPEATDAPGASRVPEVAAVVAEASVELDVTEAPAALETGQAPEALKAPEVPEMPETPEVPWATDEPGVSVVPDAADAAEAAGAPAEARVLEGLEELQEARQDKQAASEEANTKTPVELHLALAVEPSDEAAAGLGTAVLTPRVMETWPEEATSASLLQARELWLTKQEDLEESDSKLPTELGLASSVGPPEHAVEPAAEAETRGNVAVLRPSLSVPGPEEAPPKSEAQAPPAATAAAPKVPQAAGRLSAVTVRRNRWAH